MLPSLPPTCARTRNDLRGEAVEALELGHDVVDAVELVDGGVELLQVLGVRAVVEVLSVLEEDKGTRRGRGVLRAERKELRPKTKRRPLMFLSPYLMKMMKEPQELLRKP